MTWRLYDTINSRWYNDERYLTQGACLARGNFLKQEAEAFGETLELLVRPLDPRKPFESFMEEDELR